MAKLGNKRKDTRLSVIAQKVVYRRKIWRKKEKEKKDLHYLANTLTNTNDKANDFTREDNNLIPWQIDNAERYYKGIFFWLVYRCFANPMA